MKSSSQMLGLLLSFVLGCIAGGLLVIAAMSKSPKAKLAAVEDRLAIAYDFDRMTREDMVFALALSLECIKGTPEDVDCYESAIHWYKAIGANAEAQSLAKKAPSRVQKSLRTQQNPIEDPRTKAQR